MSASIWRLDPDPWMPSVSVILPCKGLDFELEKNVEAVFRQVYPFFEVLIVTATEADDAVEPLRHLAAKFPGHRIRFVTAGLSPDRGEKVHNLIQALAHVDPASDVLVFTDSDSRPHLCWLQELVAPLRNENVGLSTGYRWYYPTRGNLASVIRSAWNGSIATLLGNHNHNFAWGGSMAIRKTTFHSARVLDYWQRSISDDYSMTRALKDAKLRIHYEPRCLIGSHGCCGWGELLEWSTRQMILTKVYSRKFWQLAFVSQWTFSSGLVVGAGGCCGYVPTETGKLVDFGRLERRNPKVCTSGRALVPLWRRPRLVSNAHHSANSSRASG
jgi:cellulose synthase/poly-beta-1,6-N-acetylglucosamine synthase-like glycosyltransferase